MPRRTLCSWAGALPEVAAPRRHQLLSACPRLFWHVCCSLLLVAYVRLGLFLLFFVVACISAHFCRPLTVALACLLLTVAASLELLWDMLLARRVLGLAVLYRRGGRGLRWQ